MHEAFEGHQPHNRFWVQNVLTERGGSEEEFIEWFKSFSRVIPEGWPNGGEYGFWNAHSSGQALGIDEAAHMWSTNRDLSILKQKLAGYYPAMTRENLIGAPGTRDVMTPATHPMYELWDNVEVEEKLSRMTQRAFGFPISINRYTQNPALLCGTPGMPNEPLPPSRELLQAYAALSPLSAQGDGVKSFTGLALHAIAGRIPVVMIDEPEAFLHPPQARLIGRLLASEAAQNGQVLIATHSGDVLEGILDGARDREVKIIRVDNVTDPEARSRSVLRPERVAQLWKDPLLRYSRLLDGLFHKGIVICEADSDCRFYAATLDTFLTNEKGHDLLFTHVGGKGRLAQAAREIAGFRIPVAIIGDLDVLHQKGQVEDMIRALDGDLEQFQSDVDLIRNQVDSRKSAPLASALKAIFAPFMKMADDRRVGEEEINKITESIRLRSGWKEVKRSGISSFEGVVYQAVVRVIDGLADIGLFLVPVGELERWYPGLNAGHGPAFVSALLEGGHHNAISPDLSTFLQRFAKHFHLL